MRRVRRTSDKSLETSFWRDFDCVVAFVARDWLLAFELIETSSSTRLRRRDPARARRIIMNETSATAKTRISGKIKRKIRIASELSRLVKKKIYRFTRSRVYVFGFSVTVPDWSNEEFYWARCLKISMKYVYCSYWKENHIESSIFLQLSKVCPYGLFPRRTDWKISWAIFPMRLTSPTIKT